MRKLDDNETNLIATMAVLAAALALIVALSIGWL